MLCCRQSDNHMTRVQELGRLCRYPSTSSDKVILPACDTDQLAGHQGSIDHLDLQLQKAFEFASNRPLTPVHAPIWHSTALSLSGTAVNVHAHISWMSALRQKPSRRTLANLKTLLERVQGLVDKAGSAMSDLLSCSCALYCDCAEVFATDECLM